ncbi:fimbrial protein [Cronobacter dublinensis]|uniref:fimbrial protein n=1 Tax=Cronobacter dublinensis TaxID=413497 RepID=UPI0009DBFF02|nr:fimbrial protein [Cronobacter dublinensis]MDI6427646.1 fimbrial protein [Cronobacter dublinensis]
MKKLALTLASGMMLLCGAAHADVQDNGHDMVIYGKLQTAKSGCTVLMSKYVINLSHSNKSLKSQGTKINTSFADDKVNIQLGGQNCDANEGYSRIGLKFLGTVDSSEGTTLANTDTSSAAAQGVGIQLEDMFGQIIKPNVTIARFPSAYSSNGAPTDIAAMFPLYLSLVQLKGQETTPGNILTNMTVQIERL